MAKSKKGGKTKHKTTSKNNEDKKIMNRLKNQHENSTILITML